MLIPTETELEFLNHEYDTLDDNKTKQKESAKLLKVNFDKEKDDPWNGKSQGQTVRAGMEDILRDNGIDMGQYFGGNIQGSGCHHLMSHSQKITEVFISFFIISTTNTLWISIYILLNLNWL